MFGLGIACAGAAGVALAMFFHSRPTLRCSGSPGIPWRNPRWTGQGREPIGGGTCRRSDPDRLHGAASVRLRLPGSLPLACCNIPGGIMGWLARWRRWRNLAELQGDHIAAEDANLGHAKQDIDLPVPHPFQLFALRSAPQRRPATFRTDDLARLSPTTPLWKRRILRGDSKD
jgi:hypothetical protein